MAWKTTEVLQVALLTMNKNVFELFHWVNVPVGFHWFILFQVILNQIDLFIKNCYSYKNFLKVGFECCLILLLTWWLFLTAVPCSMRSVPQKLHNMFYSLTWLTSASTLSVFERSKLMCFSVMPWYIFIYILLNQINL